MSAAWVVDCLNMVPQNSRTATLPFMEERLTSLPLVSLTAKTGAAVPGFMPSSIAFSGAAGTIGAAASAPIFWVVKPLGRAITKSLAVNLVGVTAVISVILAI